MVLSRRILAIFRPVSSLDKDANLWRRTRYRYLKLEGCVYRVPADQYQRIVRLRKRLEMQWRGDLAEHADASWTQEWLEELPRLRFELATVVLDQIKPRQQLMSYATPAYSFARRLEERASSVEGDILDGESIPPLVVRKRDMELMHGYTRYFVLRRLGVRQVYAYLAEA